MNIIFIITGLNIGGAEKQVCALADEFILLGHRVSIISLTGLSVVEPENREVNIYELAMRKSTLGLLQALWKAKKIILYHQPDIIHSHMFHANIFSRILRAFVKIPRLICTAHNTNEGGKLRMLLYRLTNFLSNVNTNVSEEAVYSFIMKRAVKPNKMLVMSNGIDACKFFYSEENRKLFRSRLSISDQQHLFIAIGRLQEQKDYQNLLYAFSLLLKERPLSYLIIVGDGPLKNKLIELAIKLNINKYTNFLGARNDISEIMSSCDTFVLSSKYEGFGLVVAEAMACQRYVVATDSGGVKSVLDKYGILVPIQDSKALSEAMKDSIDKDNDEKYYLGLDARNHIIKNFSIKEIASKWLNLYKR
ncbi:glycosyltransferase [Photorhabdus sp. RM71S]|uniref:glycosyltransferase n=1 Tax=Photorhabdus sp. RM71S TaxID=3342824 RepID=UPI0036DEAB42